MARPNPTVQRGIVSSVTDRTLEKRDISEAIDLLDPFETPMLNMVGRDSLSTPCTQLLHEWIEDRLIPRAGTLAAAHIANSGQLQVAASQAKYIYTDDLLLVGSVIYRVVAGPPDSDVLTVSVISSLDTAQASGAEWRKLGQAAPEGGNAKDENRRTVPTTRSNRTQIFKDTLIVTGTMEHITRYGIASERAYNEAKVLKALAMDLEQEILYGVQSFQEGPPRNSTMGGLFDFVYLAGVAGGWDTVYNAGGTDLSQDLLDDMLQVMWENGGSPDYIMVNATNKRKISSWIKPSVRSTMSDKKFGATVEMYESDFGVIDVVLNRNLRPSDIILGTSGKIGLGPLQGRAFSSRLLPSTLDGTWWEILGEYTMEVHGPAVNFAWIYNTNTATP